MTTNLQALLDLAISAIPAKSPVRAQIAEAMEKRALGTARALKAHETMRANREAAAAAAAPPAPVKGKGKAPVIADKATPAPSAKSRKVKMQLTASNKMRSARKPAAPAATA